MAKSINHLSRWKKAGKCSSQQPLIKNKKEKKQTDQSFTAFSHIRKDMRLHLTDRPVYTNSLQSPFLEANYFCIKLCRLFSATCLTD